MREKRLEKLGFCGRNKAVADGIRLLGDNPTLKGKLLEFEFWMQKQGYKPPTIRGRVVRVGQLAAKGANLYDPGNSKSRHCSSANLERGHQSQRRRRLQYLPNQGRLNMEAT